MEVFALLLLGHFVGDFVFQNDWMAKNKKEIGVACITHCTIYTSIILLFLYFGGITPSILLFLYIYVSHYILDGTNLVSRWMKFYNIRSWDTNLPRTTRHINKAFSIDNVEWTKGMSASQIVNTIFGSFIYIVIDNTLHILMMYIIISLYV